MNSSPEDTEVTGLEGPAWGWVVLLEDHRPHGEAVLVHRQSVKYQIVPFPVTFASFQIIIHALQTSIYTPPSIPRDI